MSSKIVITNSIEINSNPARRAHIWRPEISFWRALDQRSLQTRRRRNPYGDVSVLVMIVGEHRKYSLVYEKSWLAVRKLLGCACHGHANAPDAYQVIFSIGYFALSRHDDTLTFAQGGLKLSSSHDSV